MEFQLTGLTSSISNCYGSNGWNITATIQVSAKVWTKYRDDHNLGSLYLDVSNHVYSLNSNIPAYHPTVDHSKNAVKGIKTITLTYFLDDPNKAEVLGCKVTWLKSGEFLTAFSEYIDLLPKYDNVIQFKAVLK